MILFNLRRFKRAPFSVRCLIVILVVNVDTNSVLPLKNCNINDSSCHYHNHHDCHHYICIYVYVHITMCMYIYICIFSYIYLCVHMYNYDALPGVTFLV